MVLETLSAIALHRSGRDAKPEEDQCTLTEAITERAGTLLTEELDGYRARTPRSRALFERAEKAMPFGVTSSFQAGDPYPIYLVRWERGAG